MKALRGFVARNKIAAILGALVLVCMVFAGRLPGPVSAWVTGLTALVVLWYTIETSAIRKQGEEEARRRRTPILCFTLAFPEGENPKLEVRFVVENKTDRLAIIRPTVRLKPPEGEAQFEQGVYSGKQDWIIWAFDAWNGHFPLRDVLGEEMHITADHFSTYGPIEYIPIDVSVAVFNGRGEFQYLFRREYYVTVKNRREFVEAWPEVTPISFPTEAPYPEKIELEHMPGSRDLL